MQDSRSKNNWLGFSYFTASNQTYISQIYEDFLKDPGSVDISWHNIFEQLSKDNQLSSVSQSSAITDLNNTGAVSIKILQLISSFRMYGHQYSKLDPLGSMLNVSTNDLLKLEHYKFESQDFNKVFNTSDFSIKKGKMNLENIYQFLKNTYCGSIGIEYMHILDINKVLWIQDYYESQLMESNTLANSEQMQFLKEIIAAEELERYLGTKFPGVKRFSLEGGDVLIPMLKEIIRYSVCNYNVQDIFIGMAHRGRLNVLVNVLGKNPQDLFNEFHDTYQSYTGSGDVKYHQGLCSEITVDNHTISASLLFNPSHLEIITPIVMGVARSKIDQAFSTLKEHNQKDVNSTILPIAIHGDAAISAQGVVQESLNMSNTYAYNIGGMIHIVVNNQIGFTTSNIYNIRSTPYCTDIAKMIQAPIFHVNADDVNAVILVTRFALNFRNQFKCDVIVDLVCYRRHGHNEVDEPSVTQPLMYQKIRNHPTVKTIYSKELKLSGIIYEDSVKNIINKYRIQLDQKHCVLKTWQPVYIQNTHNLNRFNQSNSNNIDYKNTVNNQYLKNLAYRINNIPSDIIMHDRVNKIYKDRMDMALGKRLFDWGAAEILAYATLLDQGYTIRLSGEDVTRGTFFHRHVVIHDQNSDTTYIPLMNIRQSQGLFFAWDSVLSEEAAMAFEYGYAAMSSNNTLVIWEAQFGDFSNGAQVIIDQFISSSEQKWNQLCGLIILLPHGYEGQGPEHSSCRIERYLQLCAEHNMRVCIPSTPAQIYHLFRQHAHSSIKKPLIIASPKSLLRHSMVVSSIDDLAYGSFDTVLHEKNEHCIANHVNKIIICTGKIYYDLVNERNQTNSYNIAIIRIEQLYPFPDAEIQIALQPYFHVKCCTWCQEEPKNQGAWHYIQRCFDDNIKNISLNYVGRANSASPAVGRFSVHQTQQKTIIKNALNLK